MFERYVSRSGSVLWIAAALLLACHKAPTPPESSTPAAARAAAPVAPHLAPADKKAALEDPPLAIWAGEKAAPVGTRATCPVCGDEFVVEAGSPVRHHKGKTLAFCCERCLPHFQKDPDLILNQ